MQARLEKCIANFQNRKLKVDKKNTKSSSSNLSFYIYESTKKLTEMDKFLIHLKKYDVKTRKLMEIDPENENFYKTHYEAVVHLLEKIEKSDFHTLSSNDFILNISRSTYVPNKYEVDYEKALIEFDNKKSSRSQTYGLISLGFTIITIALSVILAVAIAPHLIISAGVGLAAFTLISALIFINLSLFIACYLMLNRLSGNDSPSYLSIGKEPSNPYLQDEAFDCELLKRAYEELNSFKLASSNDEIIESGINIAF